LLVKSVIGLCPYFLFLLFPMGGVGQVATDLGHPRSVGLRANPCDLGPPRRQLDHKQHHNPHQTRTCPHFVIPFRGLWRTRFHYRQDTVFNALSYLALLEQLADPVLANLDNSGGKCVQ